jgi:uncharacterized protein YceH (UPF0502 family)
MTNSFPKLNDAEARVLGVLIEKSLTTPDNYPLSINATINGCNQKSNRHPQVSFVEAEVVLALQGLVPKFLAGKIISAGSRVEKFKHTAVKTLGLDAEHLAILAELMMRGPQAAGDLRARVHRMASTPTLADLAPRLDTLVERGLLRTAPPAAGSRAARFAQMLCPDLHPIEAGEASAPAPGRSQAGTPASPGLASRVERLENEVAQLRESLQGLLDQLT